MASKLELRACPPPYEARLAISSDPDATTPREWEQVHELVWRDLELPIADSFFLVSRSERYPDQVSVETHPEILSAHPHDTMHTWGDFCDTVSHVFTREDAVYGLELLRRYRIVPRVWVDHADFSGNLLHNALVHSQPILTDASGHESVNHTYTLDLIEQAGVRYVWDGALTEIVGQDRNVGARERHARRLGRDGLGARLWAAAEKVGAPLWRQLQAGVFAQVADGNAQYVARRFSDDRRLYRFRRFGRWNCADVDGLARLLAPSNLDALCNSGGTAIVYTHLGKRPAVRLRDDRHFSAPTIDALSDLVERHRSGRILVSSVSTLLDALVLRDHAIVRDRHIDLKADGIRFATLARADLSGVRLGVMGATKGFELTVEGQAVDLERRDLGSGCWEVSL